MTASSLEPADRIRIGLDYGGNSIRLKYEIDREFSGNLELRLPFQLEAGSTQFLNLFGAFGAAFFAQLCLAREIHVDLPSSSKIFAALSPTIRTLYAVRGYRDQMSPVPDPVFHINRPIGFHKSDVFANDRRTVLLWSGGLDSTLAHTFLKLNGYQVMPLHIFNGNVDAAANELVAVKRLAQLMECPCEIAELIFDEYLAIAARYSPNARGYPAINSVPHGRELLLLPLALLYAKQVNASSICFGFENSTWKEQFEFEGQTYSRYDTQSEFCNINLQKIVNHFVTGQVSIFSPLAPITEFRKFRTIVGQFPDLASIASFCFWGKSCGLCKKCTLYYIFQRSMGVDTITFEHNPIAERSPFLEHAALHWDSPDFRENNWALARIIGNGDIRPGEDLLIEYRDKVYPLVQPRMDEWEVELMATHPVALLPPGFVIPTWR